MCTVSTNQFLDNQDKTDLDQTFQKRLTEVMLFQMSTHSLKNKTMVNCEILQRE